MGASPDAGREVFRSAPCAGSWGDHVRTSLQRRFRLSASIRGRLHLGIDVVLGILLLLGAAAHACGSFAVHPTGSEILVWSLSGSALAGLLAILNLVRTARPQDRTLAWICAGGCLLWAFVGIGFGLAIDRLLDPRVVFHVVVGAALVDCSIVTATRKDGIAVPPSCSASPVKPAVKAVELPVAVPVRSPPPIGRIPPAPELRLVRGGAEDA
jgi:hypothetical protein